MKDVKEQIISLLDHQPEEALEPVLRQLKAKTHEIAAAAFGGWTDMEEDLYHGLVSGEYRRTPDENRQLNIEQALDQGTDETA